MQIQREFRIPNEELKAGTPVATAAGDVVVPIRPAQCHLVCEKLGNEALLLSGGEIRKSGSGFWLITPSEQFLQLAVDIAILSFSLVQLQPFQQFA